MPCNIIIQKINKNIDNQVERKTKELTQHLQYDIHRNNAYFFTGGITITCLYLFERRIFAACIVSHLMLIPWPPFLLKET